MVASQLVARLDPTLRLTVRGLDVYVQALRLAREEEEPESAVAKDLGLKPSDDVRSPGRWH